MIERFFVYPVYPETLTDYDGLKFINGQFYGTGHIKLVVVFVDKKNEVGVLCGRTFEGATNERKTPLKNVPTCEKCLELFKASNHPEAVAYRRAWSSLWILGEPRS